MEEVHLGSITLTKYGMLYLEDYETAVISDLHLGYEDVMASQGLFLPRIQKRVILSLLEEIFSRYSPRQLVINGDFKHEFSRNMPQEWDEIEEVLEYITSQAEIIVVRGNHDNFLRGILRKRNIELVDSYTLGPYNFVHGHRDVDLKGITIIGHEHPSVSLRDEIYATVKIPCFLYSPDLIVLPAISIYASGTDITKSDFLSPILRKNKRDFEVFGIDETLGILPLGRLSSLLAPSGDY